MGKTLQSEEKNAVYESLAASFDLIVLVDLDTGKETHFRDANAFDEMETAMTGLDYFGRTKKYAETCVIAEEKDSFLERMQPEKIKAAMAAGKVYPVKYHAVLQGKLCSMETLYIPYKGDAAGKNLTIKAVHCLDA